MCEFGQCLQAHWLADRRLLLLLLQELAMLCCVVLLTSHVLQHDTLPVLQARPLHSTLNSRLLAQQQMRLQHHNAQAQQQQQQQQQVRRQQQWQQRVRSMAFMLALNTLATCSTCPAVFHLSCYSSHTGDEVRQKNKT
jgi:hypothetical protein